MSAVATQRYSVVKRDNTVVDFKQKKIVNAIHKAMIETSVKNALDSAYDVADTVTDKIHSKYFDCDRIPEVEDIQDEIEETLMVKGYTKTAKAYILYRNMRRKHRNKKEEKTGNELLTEKFLSLYKHKPNPFPTELGEFIFYRTYSRWLEDEGRREYWWETVKRAVEYNCSLAPTSKKEAEELFDNVYHLRNFLAGRTLWTASTASSKKYGMSNFNCSFSVIDNLKAYLDMYYLLLVGSGVGFRVLPRDVEKLAKIRQDVEITHKYYEPVAKNNRREYTDFDFDNDIVIMNIGDSKEGWVQALKYYFEFLTDHAYSPLKRIIFNYDSVRPQGEPLKTFGGTASGHHSLKRMFTKIDKLLKNQDAVDSLNRVKLRPIDAMDIANIIAENVVCGGVRRSSQICLFSKDDQEIAQAKNNLYIQKDGEWVVNTEISHRQMSNNSIYYEEKPSREQLSWHIKQMRFSGEPGFINAVEAKRRREDFNGVNPCFTGDMKLLTEDGYRRFDELAKKNTVKLINKDGNITQGRVWSNGVKDTVELKFIKKPSIYCTPDHTFMLNDGTSVEAKHLKDKRLMPYLKEPYDLDVDFVKLGFIQGDGNLTRFNSDIHRGYGINLGKDDGDVKLLFTEGKFNVDGRTYYTRELVNKIKELKFNYNSLPKRALPKTYNNWTRKQKLSFLRGLYSANGSVINNRGRVTLKTTCKRLAEQVKDSIEGLLDIQMYITTTKESKTKFDNGTYTCRESYDLNIGNYEGKVEFYNHIGFIHNYKTRKLHKILIETSPLVVNVKNNGKQEVFDFNEPVTNWGVVEGKIAHNCAEILLDSKGVCNLTSLNVMAFVREDGTLDKKGLFRAQELSARAGYRMSLIEFELNEWDMINKRDRLIGCSLTGWQDMCNALGWNGNEEGIKLQEKLLKALKDIANNAAQDIADKLCNNVPKLVTTVKPEGCLTKDHIRTLDQGILFLDEIKEDIDMHNGFQNVNGFSRDGNKINEIYTNDKKEIIKLTLQNGRKLELTKEHPLSINNEWVEAKNIKIGDKIDFKLGQYKKTTHTKLSEVSIDGFRQGDNGINVYSTPDMMNEDLAWLIGAYLANGSFPYDQNRLNQSRIKFHCYHYDVHKKVQRIWKEQFGVETDITKSSDRDSYTQDFASTQIRKWLKVNNLHKKDNFTRIPKPIRTSTKKDILAFITGYADNDGCFYNKSFCIDSVNEKFIRHLQEVAEAVGLSMSFIVNAERNGYSDNIIYKTHMSRVYSNKKSIEYINSISVKAKDRPLINSEGYRYVSNPYKVSSIDFVESKKTYDIKVDKEHWYYQGGLKSHNTQTQMPTVSSGLHFSHSPYYIRRVRISSSDPLVKVVEELGYPMEPQVGQDPDNADTMVIEFPVRAPEGKTKGDVPALEQLEIYKMFMRSYVEHNASITVHVKDNEWDNVEDWLWENWNDVVGISFLSYSDNFYEQMPYEEITKEEYEGRVSKMARFNPALVSKYETYHEEREIDDADCESGLCPIR